MRCQGCPFHEQNHEIYEHRLLQGRAECEPRLRLDADFAWSKLLFSL
jgi:hypothetical protein